MVEPLPTVTPPAFASKQAPYNDCKDVIQSNLQTDMQSARKNLDCMHAQGPEVQPGHTCSKGHSTLLSLTHDNCAAANPAVVPDGDRSRKFGAIQAVTPLWVQRVPWRVQLYHGSKQNLHHDLTPPEIYTCCFESNLALAGPQSGHATPRSMP
jgi:hypothetical protein